MKALKLIRDHFKIGTTYIGFVRRSTLKITNHQSNGRTNHEDKTISVDSIAFCGLYDN